MTKVTPFLAGRIVQAHSKQPRSIAQTARDFNLSWSTIKRVLTNGPPRGYQKPRRVPDSIRTRRTLVKSLAQKTGRRGYHTYPLFSSAPAIHAELVRRGHEDISVKIVQRDLVAAGFRSLVRRKVPTREPVVHAKRLCFVQKIIRKGRVYMRRIIFSDEHVLSTNDHSDRRQWVLDSKFVLPRQHKRPQNVPRLHCFAAIGVGYKSPLILLKDRKRRAGEEAQSFRQNSQSYIKKCLSKIAPHITNRPFMQDGASCHTSGTTRQYLHSKMIPVVEDWPPYSPDLNPIEELWAELNRRVGNLHPTTLEELEEAALKAWASIPQSMVDSFVLSFEEKVRQCAANGGKCSAV